MTAVAHSNRLANEASPYLQQHAHNPVDWYAWRQEAFEKAVAENKPIFLSIGYSTCHWCHVMERESFEDDATARLLNEHFVSIKVDREERPDVDHAYMAFVQATTGSGGWPLSVFLTPARKPFFGGTYFPTEDRFGRRSFCSILRQIIEIWSKRADDVCETADDLCKRLQGAVALATPDDHDHDFDSIARAAATTFMRLFDAKNGGFGSAPKFPQPSLLKFLLRYASTFGAIEPHKMVEVTCENMALGGIFDHLGGGFARYSVDSEWRVPHFEKMLYDNAQIAEICLILYANTKHPVFAETAKSIFSYVARDMLHADGGFFSAEDADSEGHEGKFYCWTLAELRTALSPNEFEVARRCFALSPEGNFVDHSHPTPLRGQNVLALLDHPKNEAESSAFESAKRKMRDLRFQRVRPLRDEKILVSWNGMMLAAFALGFGVLGDPAYLELSTNCLNFTQKHLWQATPDAGILYHRWRDGARDEVQLLSAYANILAGALSLYEVTLAGTHLSFAIDVANSMIRLFCDEVDGGFWPSPKDADLYLHVKEDHDGAEPSAASVATLALAKLSAISGQTRFAQAAHATINAYKQRLWESPTSMPLMLVAADFLREPPLKIVFTGAHELPDAWRAALYSSFTQNRVIVGQNGPVDDFSKGLPSGAEIRVFACTADRCLPPISEPLELAKLLADRALSMPRNSN